MKKFLILISVLVFGFIIYREFMLQDWTQHIGNDLTGLSIKAPYNTSTNLDSLIEAGALDGIKIGNQLIVGGAGNQNGVFEVVDSNSIVKLKLDVNGLNLYDTAGNVLGTLDASGLTINNGKVTIKNSSNTTILDPTGLVSTANFPNGSYSSNTAISTTSGTLVDITGSSLTFSLSRQSNVFIFYSAQVDYGGFFGVNTQRFGVEVGLVIDGTLQNYPSDAYLEMGGLSGSVNIDREESVSLGTVYNLAAGSHTIKLQWRSLTGGSNVNMLGRELFYMILGS